MSKKLLSVLLAVLMVISSISCIFTITASAEELYTYGDNLIRNGDFENTASFDTKNYTFNKKDYTAYTGKSIMNNLVTLLSSQYWWRTTGGNQYTAERPTDLADNPAYGEGGEEPKYIAADYSDINQPAYFVLNTARITAGENSFVKINSTLHQGVAAQRNTTYRLTFKAKVGGTGLTSVNVKFAQPFVDTLGGTNMRNYTQDAFAITNVEGSNATASTSSFNVDLSKATTEWKEYEIVFTTGDFLITPDAEYAKDDKPAFIPSTISTVLSFTTNNKSVKIQPSEVSSDAAPTAENSYATSAMFIDDIVLQKRIDTTEVAASAFINYKGENIVGGEYAKAVANNNGDGTTTLSAEYKKDYGTMVFRGWYVDDELYSENEMITVASDETTKYVPKFYTKNLLAAAGSYENSFAEGDDLSYIPPFASGEVPIYSDGKGWSFNFNGGYITSLPTADYYQGVYGETIYKNDGTPVVVSAKSTGSRNNVPQSYPTLISTDAYTGQYSVSMKATIARAIGIPVRPGKTYDFSAYIKSITKSAANVYSGITTSVNITSADTKSGLAHIIQSASQELAGYALAVGKGTYPDWKKVTYTFTVPANTEIDTVYFAVYSDSNSVLIDDLVCVEQTKDTELSYEIKDTSGNAITAGNETVSTELLCNYDGTATASVDFDECDGAYIFEGWYDGDNLISQDLNFTYAEGSYDSLKAVIISRNILSNQAASFEGFDSDTTLSAEDANLENDVFNNEPVHGDWLFAKNAGGYYGQVKSGTKIYDVNGNTYTQTGNGVATSVQSRVATVVTTEAHLGGKSLHLNTNFGTAELAIDVEKNTNYTVSYYLKSDKADVKLKGSSILSTINIGSGASVVADDDANASIADVLSKKTVANTPSPEGHTPYVAFDYVNEVDMSGGWTKITLNFNSGNLERVWLIVSPNSNETYYLDDLAVYESITTYDGTAIRAEKANVPQALRNKFTISKDLIENGIADWQVAEYGSIAMRTAKLDGAELTVDGIYNGKTAVKGVAYNKADGVKVVFDESDTHIQYTAALFNIGYNKTTGETDYTIWGENYTVRNYVILTKGERQMVIYGDEAVASIFGVMYAIENGTNANDQAIVAEILKNETVAGLYAKYIGE